MTPFWFWYNLSFFWFQRSPSIQFQTLLIPFYPIPRPKIPIRSFSCLFLRTFEQVHVLLDQWKGAFGSKVMDSDRNSYCKYPRYQQLLLEEIETITIWGAHSLVIPIRNLWKSIDPAAPMFAPGLDAVAWWMGKMLTTGIGGISFKQIYVLN